jgi:hypothetical protein
MLLIGYGTGTYVFSLTNVKFSIKMLIGKKRCGFEPRSSQTKELLNTQH